MKKAPEPEVPATVLVMRQFLLEHYHDVIHDLNCVGPHADADRALRALAVADWSVLELSANWYDWWLTR